MRAEGVASEAAAAAHDWAHAGIAERLAVLQAASRTLVARREAFVAHLRGEGLSEVLAEYWGGWALHCGDAELLRRYAHRLCEVIDTPSGTEVITRRPDGVVLLITPANAPTLNAMALFSILLPGNAVVVRAPAHDRGVRFLVDQVLRPALQEAGFAPALLTVVTGRTRDVLAEFLPCDAISTIVYFGNAAAGAQVARDGDHYGKRVVLELEGSDPMIVWRDADVGRAIADACHAFDASTQLCLVPKQFLVHTDVVDAFVDGVVQRVGQGLPTVEMDRRTGVLAPLVRAEHYVAARDELAALGSVRCGGYRHRADGAPDPDGAYGAPTVVVLDDHTVTQAAPRCLEREIYFPLVPVVRFDGEDRDIARRMAAMTARSPSAFGPRCGLRIPR